MQSAASDTRGKHRILAEVKRLDQEARFLEVSFVHFVPFSSLNLFIFILFGFLVENFLVQEARGYFCSLCVLLTS